MSHRFSSSSAKKRKWCRRDGMDQISKTLTHCDPCHLHSHTDEFVPLLFCHFLLPPLFLSTSFLRCWCNGASFFDIDLVHFDHAVVFYVLETIDDSTNEREDIGSGVKRFLGRILGSFLGVRWWDNRGIALGNGTISRIVRTWCTFF